MIDSTPGNSDTNRAAARHGQAQAGWSDVAFFAARAARLGPDTLVRVQPAVESTQKPPVAERSDTGAGVESTPTPGFVHLWAVLPLKVLAQRVARAQIDADATFRAADLAVADTWPQQRHDSQWRAALPNSTGILLERIPAPAITQLVEQARETLEARRGGSVGDRRLRDALLDHEALTIHHREMEYKVQLRLAIAAARMGFIGDDEVRVKLSGRRIGLESTHGTVWQPDTALRLL
ncbi:hypothetical protein [Natronoglycomyces albus]|uniref:DUF8185 domain-containing protein n=1 Tax=Natronoglycomyces albus TaxID=2811108 RepID=A0A895XMC2_9ACTN|nr:hypothetical protein [Natronoglycomyces albus]QSB06267.1 hypothetical protein JQS30_04990 [Natronoglycomyces albus]